MGTELHWVEGPWQGKLALSARPRGGDWLEDELLHWKQDGVDTVVSLLEPAEAVDLDLAKEGSLTRRHDLAFQSIPIGDRQVPLSRREFISQVEQLERELERGRNVVLHCRQGIGRTGLVAACLLILHGVSASDAVILLSEARGIRVPETPEQRSWLDSFADSFALAR